MATVHVTGTLQYGVRAFLTRANTPAPELRGHADELFRLTAQLQYQKRSNHEMKVMLHKQALVIDAFQHKWQMAGNETQAFVQRTRF